MVLLVPADTHDVARLQVEVDHSPVVDIAQPAQNLGSGTQTSNFLMTSLVSDTNLSHETFTLGLGEAVLRVRDPLEELPAGQVLGQDDALQPGLEVVYQRHDGGVPHPVQDVHLASDVSDLQEITSKLLVTTARPLSL